MIDATKYKRGTVWWVELPLDEKTHVQGGKRPCVIVSNTSVDPWQIVTVCPLSTKIDSFPTHPRITVNKDGQVLIEQIMTIDANMLGDYYGSINQHDMEIVDNTLSEYLGFSGANGASAISFYNRLDTMEKELRKLSQLVDILVTGAVNDKKL